MKIESSIEKFLNSIVVKRNLSKVTLLLNSNGQNLINGGKQLHSLPHKALLNYLYLSLNQEEYENSTFVYFRLSLVCKN